MIGYLAAPGYLEPVVAQLGQVHAVYDRLVLAEGPDQRCDWAIDRWRSPQIAEVGSISEAARLLRAQQRNWWPCGDAFHRRSELVRERLPFVSAKPLDFPETPKTSPLGGFMFLDAHRLLYASSRSSPFPNGEAKFVEYDEAHGPPSRAYLKLFEALTLLGRHPLPGQRCLDLGASPGGWTWVLARLGAYVIAIDRAPLASGLAAWPNVEARQGDAFSATPERIGGIDWLFSDVVCYPEKLFDFVHLWIDSGLCQNFVCTLKFQKRRDYRIVDDFYALPNARVVHLFHNKHELTWMSSSPA